MSNQETILVYGNCQAEVVSSVFRLDVGITAHFDIRYIPSYRDRRFDELVLTDEDIANCAFLCEQHDSNQFPQRDALPETCTIIKFPSIDCNLLWPMTAVNPYNPSEPSFPFGRFPYGDRVILSQIDAGKSPEEILEYYLNAWDDYKPDLDRLLKLELARFAARDAKCDIGMGQVFFDYFAAERPLWTVNHPTRRLLQELVERIAAAALLVDKRFAEADIATTMESHFALSPRGPLGVISVPIHPGVARHFQLSWYDENEHHFLWDGTSLVYQDYFKELIDWSILVKGQQASVVTN